MELVTPGRRRPTVFQGAGAVAGIARAVRLGLDLYRNKRRRLDPPPSEMTGSRSFRGAGAAGVYHGKFGGRPRRPRKTPILYNGFAEVVKEGRTHASNSAIYIGAASYPSSDPANSTDPAKAGRALVDIVVALLRRYFLHNHPGKFEFNSADQFFADLIQPISNNPDIDTSTECLAINYMQADGTKVSGTEVVFSGAGAANYSLRSLAKVVADEIMTQWRLGREPMIMRTYIRTPNLAGGHTMIATMKLNNLVVKCKCLTTMTVQNTTVARDAGTEEDQDSITNVEAAPLFGKLFYFRDIGPIQALGMRLNNEGVPAPQDDDWFAANLYNPRFGELKNIYSYDDVSPTGCWKVVPRPDYFKNCSGVLNVELEPGVQKKFSLRFNFVGKLTDWLKREVTNYKKGETGGTATFALQRGMGTCAILCLESRIRSTASRPLKIAYEVDTYVRTSVLTRRDGMVQHVEAAGT